jgi:hypothetical protein
MTRGDKFLLAGLLLAALVAAAGLYGRFFRFQHQPGTHQAVISVGGNVVETVALLPANGRRSIVVQGRVGASTVEVDGERIRMREAPCPGQVCVKQGWIERPGQTIACLPGGIMLRIEGAAALDAVTR